MSRIENFKIGDSTNFLNLTLIFGFNTSEELSMNINSKEKGGIMNNRSLKHYLLVFLCLSLISPLTGLSKSKKRHKLRRIFWVAYP